MYLLRHGESEFNLLFGQTGRDPGIIDAPLTPRGKEQAKGAAKHFLHLNQGGARQKPPSRILCSPYTRALQTAAPISEALSLPVQVMALLGERRLYTCDIGSRVADLKKLWPQTDMASLQEEEWWPAKVESEQDIEGRVKAFAALETLEKEKSAGEALVISHWYFIFTLCGLDCDNGQIIWRDGAGRFHRQT